MTKNTKGGLFKRGSSSIWWMRWTAKGKTYRLTTGTANREEAKNKLREKVAPFNLADEAETFRALASKAGDLESQAAALTKTEAPLVYVWKWFTGTTGRKLPRAATLRQYEFQWGRFVDWIKDHRPEAKTVEAIDHETARAFIAYARKKLTANTANKYLRFLSMLWEILRTDGWTDADNPWKKIAAVEMVQHSRRELTIAELRLVCQAAQGDLRPLLAIGIYTGLRLGDVSTLKWSEVDLDRGIIRRIPNKSQKRKTVLIPIHPVLAGILAEQERAGEYVLPRIAKDYKKHSTYVTDRVQKLFTDCGIQTTAPGEKGRAIVEVGFHSLRHSFVSLSREAGAPLAVVEAIVGHSNPAMTRHYSHVGELASAQAVALLPSILTDNATPAPAAALPAGVDMDHLRAIVGKLNGKNWKKTKKALLEVLK